MRADHDGPLALAIALRHDAVRGHGHAIVQLREGLAVSGRRHERLVGLVDVGKQLPQPGEGRRGWVLPGRGVAEPLAHARLDLDLCRDLGLLGTLGYEGLDRLQTPIVRATDDAVHGRVNVHQVIGELAGLLLAVRGERGIRGDARRREDASCVDARGRVDCERRTELTRDMSAVARSLTHPFWACVISRGILRCGAWLFAQRGACQQGNKRRDGVA